MAYFRLEQPAPDQFQFGLFSASNHRLLRSNTHTSRLHAIEAIEACREHVQFEQRIQRHTSDHGEFYFTVHSPGAGVVGVSDMYLSAKIREEAIARVRAEAPMAVLEDGLTG